MMITEALPQQLGRYQVIEELGHGSTSTVYLANDLFGGRQVAVKVFQPYQGRDLRAAKHFRNIFLNEASLVGQLSHPHIVEIYDAVANQNQNFLVIEYVSGGTLEPYCHVNQLLPLEEAVAVIFKCAHALEFALHKGIIHRDIKPANILLTETRNVKVSDFGSALMEQVDQTQINGIGSPAYMSPEQLREETLTQQTDIYSLGVVMYQLLTGRYPFDASCNASLVYQVLNLEPPPPSLHRPGIPSILDQIVMRALHKDLQQRYTSWMEFGSDLLGTVGNLQPHHSTITDTEKFNTLKKLFFFREFNEVELWEVLHITSWCRISAKTEIIQEGDVGDRFYILTQGEVEVTRGHKHLSILKPGDCFGEMLYFSETSTKRTTSITALTDVVVVEIQALALGQASDSCQVQFNKAYLRILTRKLAQTQALLSEA
jgi:serine/threonine protein kinase